MSIRTGGSGRLLAGSPAAGGRRSPALSAAAPRPSYATIALVSLAVSGLTLLLLPRGIAYDPWSWQIWGRELLHGQLHTVHAATSIKPLPVAFDSVFALLGSKAAPVLWVFTARAAAVAAVALAFRLADRFAGPAAGLLAAVGVAAIHQYAGYLFFAGMSEPMSTATFLLAADAAVAGRHRLAFFALLLTGWLRIEVWPIAVAYAAWLVWRRYRDGRGRGIAEGGWLPAAGLAGCSLLLLPVAWFGLDWIGSGTPLRSTSAAASQSQGGPLLSAHPGVATITETVHQLPVSLLVAAVLTWLWALMARRDPQWRAIAWLGAAAAGWLAVTASMAQARVATGAPRYLMPAVAVACVLGAVGIVRACTAVVGRRAGRALPAAVLALVVGIGGGIVQLAEGWQGGFAEVPQDQMLQTLAGEMPAALALAGGAPAVARCGRLATEGFQVPALAWAAHVHLDQVGPDAAPRGTVVQLQGRPAVPRGGAYHRLGSVGHGSDQLVVFSTCRPVAATGR